MTTSKPSIMDENPNLESFYRNLSLLATAALAVHISWTTASPSDCFVDWLVSAIPTMLTGFFLFGLLLYAAIEASDTQFFTLIATSTRSGHAGFRISSDPDREDRHLFNFQVITYTASLGVSIDLVYGWYLTCQVVWDFFVLSHYHLFFRKTMYHLRSDHRGERARFARRRLRYQLQRRHRLHAPRLCSFATTKSYLHHQRSTSVLKLISTPRTGRPSTHSDIKH